MRTQNRKPCPTHSASIQWIWCPWYRRGCAAHVNLFIPKYPPQKSTDYTRTTCSWIIKPEKHGENINTWHNCAQRRPRDTPLSDPLRLGCGIGPRPLLHISEINVELKQINRWKQTYWVIKKYIYIFWTTFNEAPTSYFSSVFFCTTPGGRPKLLLSRLIDSPEPFEGQRETSDDDAKAHLWSKSYLNVPSQRARLYNSFSPSCKLPL